MERSIFFNSAPGDTRTYQASDFAGYFGTVLSSGLIHTDNVPALQVKCTGGDMRTYVSPGKAIIQGYFYENTTDLYLTHDLPESALGRIDRIVLRLDKRTQSRFIRAFIVKGTPSLTPSAPALQRDTNIYELCLAEILVRANTATLLPSDLVDRRMDPNLCGLVYSLISIPTAQFQAKWDALMDSVKESGFTTTVNFKAHRGDQLSHVYYGDDTGTANAKTVSVSSEVTAINKGLGISFTNKTQNTGGVTINVNGLGIKNVLKANGLAVPNGGMKANSVYTVRYNGTAFILQGEGGEYGTAVASEVLVNKSIGTENGLVNGTMPDNRNVSKDAVGTTLHGGDLYLNTPEGYYNATSSIHSYEGNLADPKNWRSDRTMFGKAGTMPVISTGDDIALSVGKWSDGALAVYPREGYRKGGSGAGEIRVSRDQLRGVEGNLRGSNIREGVSIFGEAGTMRERKLAFGNVWIDDNGWCYVSGLAFTPVDVFFVSPYSPYNGAGWALGSVSNGGFVRIGSWKRWILTIVNGGFEINAGVDSAGTQVIVPGSYDWVAWG